MKDYSIYVNSFEKMERAKLKKKLYFRYRILMALFLVVILCTTIFAYRNREFHSYTMVKSLEEENSGAQTIVNYEYGIIRYGESQIAYYDKSGKRVWQKNYSISNPLIKTSGEYIMIADMKGKKINVYDKKGKKFELTMGDEITDAEIANQGVVAVALSTNNTNYIELYNLQGEKLVSIQSSISENGYPLDIALSPNGEILCASYFVVDGVEMKNRLTFYDFGEDGETTENMLAGFDYKNTIVPTIAFLNRNTLCAFGDDKLSVYGVGKSVKLKKETKINSSIKSIAYDNEHFAIIRECYADEKKGNYMMEIYSMNGNLVGQYALNDEYNDFHVYGNKIVLNSGYHCVIITTSGRKIFDYSFTKYLARLIPGNRDREFYAEYQDRLDVIQLK